MMMPRIAERMFNTPLMVHPGKAAALVSGLGGRISGSKIDFSGAAVVDHLASAQRHSMGTLSGKVERNAQNRPLYDVISGVAVIQVEGTLVHKGGWVGSNSGETSYEGLQAQVAHAKRNASVKGVVFEVDSYGGEVSGAFETADMIFALSQQKPTLAILTDHAYSAGYLMASAARAIVLPQTGGCGSIGVITMHADYSAMIEAQGLKVTIIAEGAHKADFNPYEALPADVADAVREDIRQARQLFCKTVAGFRGKRMSFDDAMNTESDTFVGAEAVKRGLADATGYPMEVFTAFIANVNRA